MSTNKITNVKSLSTFLLCVLLLVGAFSQEAESLYVLGGTWLHSENFDHAVGSGVGFKIGLGYRFTEQFGLEKSYDTSPSVEPEDLVALITEDSPSVYSYDL